MEKSLVFSATHLPAGQARAQQIGKHSSFIRDKTLPPKSVTSIGTPSTRFRGGCSRFVATPQSKLSLCYQASGRTLYFVEAPSAYALSITRRYPARNIGALFEGRIMKNVASIAGQSRVDSRWLLPFASDFVGKVRIRVRNLIER